MIIILLSANAAGRELPVSAFDPTCVGYATELAAATAALGCAVRDGGDHYEYGGAIYELAGEFYYTAPVTIHDDANDAYRLTVPSNAKLIALYHTHPASHPRSFEFSDTDVQVATRAHLTSYIGVVRDGQVRRFVPSKDSPGLDGGSVGTVVADIPTKGITST